MGAWMDGWVDGGMYVWMDGWTDRDNGAWETYWLGFSF